ncbi:hypothetical protein [Hymenobacter jejuensis]|uniref:Uncharacterized protein n=1 Tax=Hymenobacter jejuensis TaxID=2502781 RepID=A0A5B7ZYR0_9BACT|nr:hypothetical protein [Hymenobacter jejuensis]QDA58972.1 hypothetical protein FHG12_02125 [Hymenobacter jejuensis]
MTKKKKKANVGKKKTLLGGAAKSLKSLGKTTGLSRLSTVQKVVGGAALVGLGLSYLTKRRSTPAGPGPASHTGSPEQLPDTPGTDSSFG